MSQQGRFFKKIAQGSLQGPMAHYLKILNMISAFQGKKKMVLSFDVRLTKLQSRKKIENPILISKVEKTKFSMNFDNFCCFLL